jgi:hypothetical protein
LLASSFSAHRAFALGRFRRAVVNLAANDRVVLSPGPPNRLLCRLSPVKAINRVIYASRERR